MKKKEKNIIKIKDIKISENFDFDFLIDANQLKNDIKDSDLQNKDMLSIVLIKPEDFIKISPIFFTKFAPNDFEKNKPYFQTESVNKWEKKIYNKEPIDLVYLKFDINDNQVLSHNGRHRALASKNMRIDRIPVGVEGLIEFEKKNINNINDINEWFDKLIKLQGNKLKKINNNCKEVKKGEILLCKFKRDSFKSKSKIKKLKKIPIRISKFDNYDQKYGI